MLGVFVGLFGGQRVGHFFLGGHFGEIGPFLAHFRPKGSNREREREHILLLGFEAAGMAPWDPAGRGLVVGGQRGSSWAWRAVRRPVPHIKIAPQCLYCIHFIPYRTV